MAMPDYQFLMLPVLLLAADGETRVPDAAEKLADRLGMSVAEREEMLLAAVSAISTTASTGEILYDQGRPDRQPSARPLRGESGWQGGTGHRSRRHQC